MMFTKLKMFLLTVVTVMLSCPAFAMFPQKNILEEGSHSADSLQMVKANELTRTFQYDKAIVILEQLVEKDSLNYEAVAGLENLYFKQNQLHSAIELQDYLLRNKKDSLYYKVRKGLCLKRMGQNEKALEIFMNVYENDTVNSFIANQIGDIYKSLFEGGKAIAFYTKACEIKPNASLMSKTIDIYLKAKQVTEALAFYHRFYKEEFATNRLLHRLYGKALYLKDEFSAAKNVFERLYAGGDSSLVTTKFLGRCNWKLECYAQAISPLEHYISKDSTDYQVFYMLGSCYVNDEFIFDFEKSIMYLNTALALTEVDGKMLNLIYNELALNYQRTEQYEKELEVYLIMKENQPDSKYVDYKLATLYDYSLKNKKEALDRYQELLAYYQSDSVDDGRESDIEKFCNTRILELQEECFWESEK